ncbi:probable methyltransferase At1g29790 [Cornus florida]|uniref:probable methyltransferase At1g29790 n=1 Tax=Cornus florida TaxID=4283 RepID=UPI00289CBA8F|nr:probable methyltransferase At1g29790 [Cornus florida]
MGYTMGLNLLLLMAMVSTNILSLYHLSTTIQSKPPTPTTQPVPDHLIQQLHTIRATINHLTRLRPTTDTTSKPTKPTIPSDLLLYTRIAPIASSCRDHPDLLHQYMNYTPYSLCPLDSDLAETLILRGCHPLPRRRCFAQTPPKPPTSLPSNPFVSLPDNANIWTKYNCKSFTCLSRFNGDLGFDMKVEKSKFVTYKSDLDLPIQQIFQIAKSTHSVLRLGLDIGGGTGTFAAQMKLQNVTVISTTMNLGAPYNEAAALRGVVPLHVPLQQRLPVFDGVVDLVRCGHAVNRWIPVTAMEFLFYDIDRVLRGGGYFWLDHFFSKSADLGKVFTPLIGKLGYKKVKWAVANKSDSSGVKNGEVYLTALLQKPVSK